MTCNEEFATLWEFISSDKDLTPSEKILYSIILSYSLQEGHCWATNLQLMQKMGISPESETSIKRHIVGLKKKGWVKIEEGTRDRKIHPLKKSIRTQNVPESNPVKKEIRAQNVPDIRTQNVPEFPTPPNKDKVNLKEIKKHRGDWGKPNPSVHTNLSLATISTKMSGPPPTPGPENMVAATKEVLQGRHRLGTKYYELPEEVWPYFFGYSPRIVEEAMSRAHTESKKGARINNIAAWLFATCGRIRNER